MKQERFLPFLIVLIWFGSGPMVKADNNIAYNFFEARYLYDADRDDLDVDGDGFGLGAGIRLDEALYLSVDFEELEFDQQVDTQLIQLTSGVILPIRRIDSIAELSLLLNEVSVAGDKDTDEGFRLSVGARSYLRPEIEGRILVNYSDVGPSDTYLTIAGDYFLTKNISLNANLDILADVEKFAFGARFHLGN